LQGFNVITLKKNGVPGVEPDACFYIQNLSAVLGKARINLDIDPPPDLALETDLTSITNINDYLPLAVPEVWIYKAGALNIFRFTGTGYEDSDRSPLFPEFPVRETLPQYVRRAWAAGSSVALREFEQSLRA
jgi:Uma2 family endonuclease